MNLQSYLRIGLTDIRRYCNQSTNIYAAFHEVSTLELLRVREGRKKNPRIKQPRKKLRGKSGNFALMSEKLTS